jgi:hypothetical protein
MAKKYYAYHLVENNESGILETWSECEKLVKGKKARYKSFPSVKEAEEWLNSGAEYEVKEKKIPKLEKNALYFDAGTGRGIGVEVRVTDYKGTTLLPMILPKEKVSEYGNYVLKKGRTNNYGELVGIYIALKYAAKKGIKLICGDSRLILDYWSKGIFNRDKLEEDTVVLIEKVADLRKEFEKNGGKTEYISGDYNPADLGFHK